MSFTDNYISGYAPPAYAQYGYFQASVLPTTQNELRTIVIKGLPEDVKERELQNLCYFLPGFLASALVWEDSVPEGRVIFESSAQAQDAVARIDGNVEFDAGCLLTASLASENLQVDESQAQGKHPKVDPYPAPVTPSALVQPYAATGQPGGLLPAFPSGGMAPYGFAGAAPVATLTPRMYAPVKNEMDNPPCNTLFIGNLGEGVDENELRAVFGPLPGFQQVKVVRSPKGISAFIEFTDVGAAAACHQAQQGLILASSDRGPIRVQFSKNPFGRKREPAPSQTGSPTAAQAATAPAVVQPSQPAYATTYALPMPQPVLPAAYYGAPASGGQVYGHMVARIPPRPLVTASGAGQEG